MSININSTKQFDEALESNKDKLIVVCFYATWCGPCKQVAPLFEAMAISMTNIACLRVDLDSYRELVKKYEVTSVPTFIFIKNKQKNVV
ncbi:thioredoxin-like isoform X2 [Gordionus sp. m RMFG-2023]|uniref:thioredoxin-like isoform X2 n=1 Tax=Gordionus sp. m RMFG-2023 TaxID=3053472 RepID=UPI0031FBE59B